MLIKKPLPDRASVMEAFKRKTAVEVTGHMVERDHHFKVRLMTLHVTDGAIFFFGRAEQGMVSGYIDYGLETGGVAVEP